MVVFFLLIRRPPRTTRTYTLFPSTTLFRSNYCGKLFGDLGADVILIEPPEGTALRREPPFVDDRADVEASLPFAYSNTSKRGIVRSEEHTSELQSLMRISYAVFCLKKKKTIQYK